MALNKIGLYPSVYFELLDTVATQNKTVRLQFASAREARVRRFKFYNWRARLEKENKEEYNLALTIEALIKNPTKEDEKWTLIFQSRDYNSEAQELREAIQNADSNPHAE